MARAAFNLQGGDSTTDAPGDTAAKRFSNWRHAEQSQACGKSSLTKCTQVDYLPLRSHFNGLLGRPDKSFDDIIKSSPENDHADPNDTPEKRGNIIHLIEDEIKGTRFHINYVIRIGKNVAQRQHLQNLESLECVHLKQVLINIKTTVKLDREKQQAIQDA